MTAKSSEQWLTPGVRGIGGASLLADVGHEIPTSLLPSLLTSTLGAPAAALGIIEGVADGLASGARFAGGALADDPQRRRAIAVGGYGTTAVLSGLIGVATSVWQVAILRSTAWAARGLRVPARNALLADVVPADAYGRAYGFERAMDSLGAILGPLLGIALVAAVGVRDAILLSIIPGLLAVGAIVYAIRASKLPTTQERQPIRIKVRTESRAIRPAKPACAGHRYRSVSVTFVARVTPPLVPVILSVNVPALDRLFVDTVSVDEPVVGFGEKDADARDGRPLTLKTTL